MPYSIAVFTSQLILETGIHKWSSSNKVTEANAIIALLNTDPTRRDATLQRPPAGLQPGHRLNSKFRNDVLHLVNRGKSSGLLPTAMAAAIQSLLNAMAPPPVNTVAPALTGTPAVGQTLTCSQGTWSNSPTSYVRQWLRGVTNVGANTPTYVVVAGDSGFTITCRVTATNQGGSTSATSNGLAVP